MIGLIAADEYKKAHDALALAAIFGALYWWSKS